MTIKPTVTVHLPQAFKGDDETFVMTTLEESGFTVEIGDIDPHEYGDILTVALTIDIVAGTLTIARYALDFANWLKASMLRYKPSKYQINIFVVVQNTQIEYSIPREIQDATPLLAIDDDLGRSPADQAGRKLWEDGQWLSTLNSWLTVGIA